LSRIIIKRKKNENIIISSDDDYLVSRLTRSTASTNSSSSYSNSHRISRSEDLNSSRSLVDNNTNPPIVIICSGNGGPYELFHKNHYWLNYYLTQNYHVCLWNYRGYGLSKGIPSFKNMKEDSEVVFRYLNEPKKYRSISVHGISLGGVPACHLAK
jgi:predicted alpha/beta-fold hydrolase